MEQNRILNFDLNSNLFSLLNNETINENLLFNPYENIDIKCQYFDICKVINHLKSKKGLKIIGLNIQSLQSKFIDFQEFVDEFLRQGCYLDIICLGEIWNIKNDEYIKLKGYDFIYKCRSQTNGGGVGFYIKKGIAFKEIKALSKFEEKIIESLTLEISIGKNDKIFLTNVYRSNCKHPNLTESEQLDRFINLFSDLQADLNSRRYPSYIIGDLNFDLLKFEQHDKTRSLLENSFANGFLELISLPTRITHTSATLIDHIYTNDNKNKFESFIITADISDHFPTCTIILDKVKEAGPVFIQTQNFSEENITSFKQDMLNADWSSVSNNYSAQDAYNKFYSIFNESYSRHFPFKKVKLNKNIHKVEPFMTNALLKSRKTKFELYDIKLREPTQDNISKYNEYRKCYNKAIKTGKKLYFQKSFEDNRNDLRKTWSILREAIRKHNDKSSVITEIFSDGVCYKEGKDISNKFNEFFTTIADDISTKINPSDRDCTYYTTASDSIFSFTHIQPKDIVTIVNGLESKSSQDMLGVSNKLMKKIIENIAIPLTHIINLSLQSGNIPNELKIAKVLPIFKLKTKESDLLSNMSNYRPISLLPIFSKILEKIVANKLTAYLDDNNLIYKHQYGFQKKKSTIQPIFHLINEIVKNSNDKKYTVGVFCDLQKAFDCCSHRILLDKLSKLGINGTELTWFKNYLANRQQFVYINNEKSDMKYINKGVPQGSILGPLLFLIYINDLAKCTTLFTLLFADDTSFLISGKNLHDIINILNIELRKITYWFRTNELSLHPSKTKFMIFTKDESTIDFDSISINLDHNNDNQNDPNLVHKLSYVNSRSETPAIKFLGVYLDPKLNFKYHIDMINKKISRSLFAINAAKHIIGGKALQTLYNSLVHSHLTYCSPIWGSAAASTLDKIVKQQKKALRIITNSKYNAHTAILFKNLEILPVTQQIVYSKLQFMFDYVNHRLPCSFDNLWIRNSTRTARVLRNNQQYNVPFVRLETFKKFPYSDLPKLWNEIIIPNTNPNPENDNNNVEVMYTFSTVMSRKQFCMKLKDFLLEKLNFICNRENCSECINRS